MEGPDVYRPSRREFEYDRFPRQSYDNRRFNDDYVDNRYPAQRDSRRDVRYRDDQSHPYEWYRSRSQERQYPQEQSSRPPARRRSRSPRRDYPPPPPPSDVYRFGGDDRRTNGVSSHQGRDDFTFRSNDQREFRGGAPPPRAPREPRNQRGRGGRYNNRNGYQNFSRGGPKGANERKILHAKHDREGTPERLEGMVQGASNFKDVNELFVSDESEDEDVDDANNADVDDEPAAKRAKTNGAAPVVAEEKPKWSNPDPYFVVPPLDESRHNRKDVVQLLRKAKVEAAKTAPAANAVSRNVDFIGFGDEEDEDEEEEEDEDLVLPQKKGTMGEVSEEGEIESSDEMASKGARPAPVSSYSNGVAQKQQQAAPFSHLRQLHNIPTPQSVDVSAPGTGLQTPQEGTVVSENALEEAREFLAEIKAQDGVQPQTSKLGRAPRGKKRGHDGDIIKSWAAKDRKSSAPWYTEHAQQRNAVDEDEDEDDRNTNYSSQRPLESMEVRLHQEINDFYGFIRPQPYEERIRADLIARLQQLSARAFPGSQVYAFGSFAQGIYLPTSDMDLVLYSPGYQQSGYPSLPPKQTLRKLQTKLADARIIERRDHCQVIIGAKVPIIKFVDARTGLNVDLSLDNDSGVRALTTFDNWRRTWPFLPKLMSILKQWLLMRDMNEVFSGGLGGFSLTCMVVNMLQMKDRNLQKTSTGETNLGALLLEFLDTYGNQFRMARTGIDVYGGKLFDKVIVARESKLLDCQKKENPLHFDLYGRPAANAQQTRDHRYKQERWTIIDPNRSDNDLSGGSSQAPLIKEKLSDSCAVLRSTMQRLENAGPILRQNQSLLRLIVGGNYEKVILQRRIMLEVHKKYLGAVHDR